MAVFWYKISKHAGEYTAIVRYPTEKSATSEDVANTLQLPSGGFVCSLHIAGRAPETRCNWSSYWYNSHSIREADKCPRRPTNCKHHHKGRRNDHVDYWASRTSCKLSSNNTFSLPRRLFSHQQTLLFQEGSSCELALPAATQNGANWLDPHVNKKMHCAVNDSLFAGGEGCGKCYRIEYDKSPATDPGKPVVRLFKSWTQAQTKNLIVMLMPCWK